MKSLNDARIFHDPETASSSGASHVPSQLLSIPSPRGTISRDFCLPHETRNPVGSSGNVFEDLRARDGPSSVLFENPRNLALSSCGLRSGNTGNITRHGEGVGRKPQSLAIPTRRFAKRLETWTQLYRTGETCSQNCTMEAPRYSTSALHFGVFQTQSTSNVGKSTLAPMCAQTHSVPSSQCRGAQKWR